MIYCSTEDSQRCQGSYQHACGQVQGAQYTNVGCYEKISSSYSRKMFQCANRMDLGSSMFNDAIMDVAQEETNTKGIPNWNTRLNFNETHLNCSDDLIIAWDYLFQPWKSEQKCLTKGGDQIRLLDLTMGALSLAFDYSFKKSNTFEVLRNNSKLHYYLCQKSGTSKCNPNTEHCVDNLKFCDGIGNVFHFIPFL